MLIKRAPASHSNDTHSWSRTFVLITCLTVLTDLCSLVEIVLGDSVAFEETHERLRLSCLEKVETRVSVSELVGKDRTLAHIGVDMTGSTQGYFL